MAKLKKERFIGRIKEHTKGYAKGRAKGRTKGEIKNY